MATSHALNGAGQNASRCREVPAAEVVAALAEGL
ncbi:hypothetical protein BDK63_002300 [Halomonas campaniensis]|uniref:Uncharacterized protein n=1 Tax=Halomonas campaniensis TaxID=213554 RepID=A0A7W5PBA9_9GAMM|nr:hypothetical protein [Halomonas campaniensis]